MRNITILSAAALSLVACGSSDESTIENADGETVAYEMDRDGNDAEIRISGEDGEEMVISSTVDDGADWPDGYSVYPGAQVVRNMTMRQNDGEVMSIVLTSSATPEEMAQFYRQQAEAAGIEIRVEMSNGDTRMLSGGDEAGRIFNFTASPNADGTTANLSVGQDLD